MSNQPRMATPERVLVLAFICVLVLLFVWFEWKLIFLAFAGLLLALLLHTITTWIQKRTHMGPGWSYVATLMLIAIVVVGAGVLIIPRAVTQVSQIATLLPQSIAQVKDFLEQKSWGKELLEMVHRGMQTMDLGSKVIAITSAVVGGVADLIVIFVIGFFGALNPEGYKRGVLNLFPVQHRARMREIGDKLLDTLRWWMLGQMVPMVALGIASMVALSLLGVRLAFTLGLLTGVVVFVPYVGTILAGIPSVLMALQRGPWTALWVVILFSIFHVLEGYFLTPLVQKRAVRLPPVLTILAQFFMWSFAGILGVAIAAPLTAAVMVLTRELYLKPRDRGASLAS